MTNGNGELVVISRSGEIVINDAQSGRERERHKVPYGATLLCSLGSEVKAGQQLATFDPMTLPIVSEYAGTVRFENVVENVTVMNQVDEVTGLSSMVVIDPKRSAAGSKSKGTKTTAANVMRPVVHLVDENGNDVKIPGTDHTVTIQLPVNAIIVVRDGQKIHEGEILARIPRESQKTRDITGGLPRVAELFEARSPKDAGMLAEETGTVTFGKETKGKQRLIITDLNGNEHECLISKDKQILVHDGQMVQRGEEIVEGPADPHDILRLLGIEALARYIVDEVQDVYRLQGVKINDKHIEVIVRQMLRRVQIVDAGDTHFIPGEQVERSEMLDENDRVKAEGGTPATYQNVLLGITKASLSTDSFISAASFQETTKVLTEASLKGKMDYLRGLKENVIVGRLIPAGTGYREYVDQDITVPDQKERPDQQDVFQNDHRTSTSHSFSKSGTVDTSISATRWLHTGLVSHKNTKISSVFAADRDQPCSSISPIRTQKIPRESPTAAACIRLST